MREFAVVQFRLWYRGAFLAFAIAVIYVYVGRMRNYPDLWCHGSINDTIVATGLVLFSAVTFLGKMKVGRGGITHVFGLVMPNGAVIGRQNHKTWEKFGFEIFNRGPFLAVSLRQGELPFLWAFMMSGLEDMLIVIARHGMERVVKEKDREYLRELLRSREPEKA